MILILTAFVAVAQTSPDDPQIQQVKEETVVVFDLGRFFGYLNTMEEEQPKLALTKEQMNEIYTIMSSTKTTERMEPDDSEEMLVKLEDEILTPDQLMYADQLVIEKEQARESPTTERTTGSGGGQILSYIAGGPFNLMNDSSKTIGKDFAAFYDYVAKKLGR